MVEPYVGEIKMFAMDYAPSGWALCNGALMQIQQNQALFTLITNKYGGNATTNFNLPDLRGRTPSNMQTTSTLPPQVVSNMGIGQTGGSETVVLTAAQVPSHTHTFYGSPTPATKSAPAGNIIAQPILATTVSPAVNINVYAPDLGAATSIVALNSASISSAGSSQGRPNVQPFAVTNFCIATVGVYPPRN